ncbi:TetR family transcriptional regulator C-terminal domain-containing protein [Rhizorhapis sp. SPR117]|uniref:TetR family transcriptional regulator C-terminal domain-containing protein n=1 Tax=Rhizorhapis sp. SPR117 TaxID=2912611 RepID=UPI001F00F744|nr:TetR family transcriptional regulator C-terminal domain-containing protein [Rhizorhapis sp. SPR117]
MPRTLITLPAKPLPAGRRGTAKRTRIQVRNEERILDAAQQVFADYGYYGATMDKVARKIDMSQPNLHHYFKRKSDLYNAVLKRALETWLATLREMNPKGNPKTELSRYIRQKIELSRRYPEASRVFAGEILQGAPVLSHYLETSFKTMMEKSVAVIQHWIDNGKIAKVDPYHLIFMIWAASHHYANCLPQVTAAMGVKRLTKAQYSAAGQSICDVILHGVLPASAQSIVRKSGNRFSATNDATTKT